MKSLSWSAAALATVILTNVLLSACHPTFVVVPGAERDSLADTVTVRETRPLKPTPRPARVDTFIRIDTVTRVDTVRVPRRLTDRRVRTDTVVRVDTLRLLERVVRTDTVVRVDTVRTRERVVRTDTVVRIDTLRLTRTVVRTDTVRVPGRRFLFLPPGHFPPRGQCRVWVHGTPPGRQADPAPCDALGSIPTGAFVLFAAEAWDMDYDWAAEALRKPGTVPPEIVAVKRGGRGQPAARGRR